VHAEFWLENLKNGKNVWRGGLGIFILKYIKREEGDGVG